MGAKDEPLDAGRMQTRTLQQARRLSRSLWRGVFTLFIGYSSGSVQHSVRLEISSAMKFDRVEVRNGGTGSPSNGGILMELRHISISLLVERDSKSMRSIGVERDSELHASLNITLRSNQLTVE
jgi:hypothetical protein